jgi:hypothetical protein
MNTYEGEPQADRGSLVAGYLPDSNDVSTEAEESPLLRFVTRKRLMKAN